MQFGQKILGEGKTLAFTRSEWIFTRGLKVAIIQKLIKKCIHNAIQMDYSLNYISASSVGGLDCRRHS